MTFSQIRQGFQAQPTNTVRLPIKEADVPIKVPPLCSCDTSSETQVPLPCPPSNEDKSCSKTKVNRSSDENVPSIMFVLLGGVVMGAVCCILCLGHGDGRAPRKEETSRPLSGVVGQSSPMQSPVNQRQIGAFRYSPLTPQSAARI